MAKKKGSPKPTLEEVRPVLLFAYHAIKNGTVMWTSNQFGQPIAHCTHSSTGNAVEVAPLTRQRAGQLFVWLMMEAYRGAHGVSAPSAFTGWWFEHVLDDCEAVRAEFDRTGPPNAARPETAEVLCARLEVLLWPEGLPLRKQPELLSDSSSRG